MNPKAISALPFRNELWLAAGLIALVVVARLAPHAPNFTPVAASALFAGYMLRNRLLALAVPLGAMLLSDLLIGFHDWRVMAVVYAAIALPVFAAPLLRRLGVPLMLVPAALAGSLVFFATTNFAVWAFSGMYSMDAAGLLKCYVAALPFLHYTVAGDLTWNVVLFGGLWAVQTLPRHFPRAALR